MTTKQINEAAERLVWAFDSANVNHGEELIDLCTKEERGHRGWGPDFDKYHPSAPSARFCGKLFAVKRVAEYLIDSGAVPLCKDYIHTQKSCFLAGAMAIEHRDRIMAQWSEMPLAELAKLDYCQFVKVRTPKHEAA